MDTNIIPDVSPIMDPGSITGTVAQNVRLSTLDHFQDIRHIELHSRNIHHLYNPGDILILRPQNKKSNVEKILKLLGLENEALKPFAIVQEVFGT